MKIKKKREMDGITKFLYSITRRTSTFVGLAVVGGVFFEVGLNMGGDVFWEIMNRGVILSICFSFAPLYMLISKKKIF